MKLATRKRTETKPLAKPQAAPAVSVRKPVARKHEPAFAEGDWQEF